MSHKNYPIQKYFIKMFLKKKIKKCIPKDYEHKKKAFCKIQVRQFGEVSQSGLIWQC